MTNSTWSAARRLAIAALLLLAACGEDAAQSASNNMSEPEPDAGISDATAPSDMAQPVDMAMEEDMSPEDMGSQPDMAVEPDMATESDMATEPDMGPMTIAERCFPNRTGIAGPNYEQYMPTVGSHCLGTNHQNIFGVEKVVFLGDSITVGTPPQTTNQFFRSIMADWLANRYALAPANYQWRLYDAFNGTNVQMESGDFKSCAKWGARTDDFLKGGDQIGKCFPNGGSDRRTLTVMTMGGNDIANITEAGGTGGESVAQVQMQAEQMIADLEDAIAWLKDPVRFPDGNYVVMANPYEFTDGTGDVSSCPAANLTDLEAWDNPDDLAQIVLYINEEYMRIATQYDVDMIFMLENFCGHGFVATGPNADTNNGCYLGPNTPRWFDDTCTHPNGTGHAEIARMMSAVIAE